MTTKQQKLDEIKRQIITAQPTPELAAQATQPVFGDGNPDADIVFVGEAPGKFEDQTGKPFVGAAGKFLDEMLASIYLKRADIYITNIVKYRPPNNRDPLPEEKRAFLPYLQAQLEVIQPKIVVTLGRHSTSCFLPDLQISRIHGRPKRVRIVFRPVVRVSGGQDAGAASSAGEAQTGSADELVLVILPLFHPAAALYNNNLRQTLMDDFARIPAVLAQLANGG